VPISMPSAAQIFLIEPPSALTIGLEEPGVLLRSIHQIVVDGKAKDGAPT
jgi:hypothetical protein